MAKKEWREGEMILTFGLTKVIGANIPLMDEWLRTDPLRFEDWELVLFNSLVKKASRVPTWSEEDLKMKYISVILGLGNIMEDEIFTCFFDKKLSAKVQGYPLVVKADFVVAKGVLDFMQRPFFHFQEYKPQKNPTGDPMAQLLEAFLIGQTLNDDGKPLYGCEVIGRTWTFVVMQGSTYCQSKAFDSMEEEDLLKIIAILRKFRFILETKLL
jgi:hypothetical protein